MQADKWFSLKIRICLLVFRISHKTATHNPFPKNVNGSFIVSYMLAHGCNGRNNNNKQIYNLHSAAALTCLLLMLMTMMMMRCRAMRRMDDTGKLHLHRSIHYTAMGHGHSQQSMAAIHVAIWGCIVASIVDPMIVVAAKYNVHVTRSILEHCPSHSRHMVVGPGQCSYMHCIGFIVLYIIKKERNVRGNPTGNTLHYRQP